MHFNVALVICLFTHFAHCFNKDEKWKLACQKSWFFKWTDVWLKVNNLKWADHQS